jgi:expansin (peptidoglycan-binding protein)
MFIVSKKNFIFRFPDGSTVPVARDFMGDAPNRLQEHPLFQAAVRGGDIMVPGSTSDKAVYAADAVSEAAQAAADIRPDAPAKKARKK